MFAKIRVIAPVMINSDEDNAYLMKYLLSNSKLLLILLLFFLSFLNKVAEFSIFSWFPARKDTEENAGRVLLNLVLWVSLIRRCAFFFSFFTEHSHSLRRQQLLSCEMSLHHNVKYQRKWQFFFSALQYLQIYCV